MTGTLEVRLFRKPDFSPACVIPERSPANKAKPDFNCLWASPQPRAYSNVGRFVHNARDIATLAPPALSVKSGIALLGGLHAKVMLRRRKSGFRKSRTSRRFTLTETRFSNGRTFEIVPPTSRPRNMRAIFTERRPQGCTVTLESTNDRLFKRPHSQNF